MPFLGDEHVCACHRRSAGGEFTIPGAIAHYPPDLSLEPAHLEIDLRLDLERQTAGGTVTTTVEARREGPRSLELHAVDFQSVRVADADGKPLSFRYDGRTIHATWEQPFAAGERRRLAVTYEVEKPVTGLFFSKPSKEYPKQVWYAATDHETERARHWLPCIDLPGARPALDIKLRAESRFTILANGALVGETDHGDGTKTAHWRLAHPCPSYLTCFAVGEFTRADDGEFEGRPVSYFSSREFSADDLKRSFGRTRKMLAWITKKLGAPCPWPKYFQFALPGIGGAMENISLVSWDDQFVLDKTLAREWTWLVDQINVHEMAHSWFGDTIVCRDFAHAWLKESWATYIESCWLEDEVSRDEGHYDFWVNAQQYFVEADGSYKRPIVTRVYNHSWQMYDRHLYPGGACRLHTLRKLLGDGVFWGAVQDYVKTYSGGQVVETDDFRRIMEQHSGRSLGRFFDQWFHSKGYPALKVGFSWDAERKEGTFEVEQTQVDEKEAIPVFELELQLGWVIDGKLATRKVTLEEKKHTFVIPLPSDPEQVRVDPHIEVLHKLDFNPGEVRLRRQLTHAEDVVGRIHAGVELAKTGRAKNVEAVAAAWRKEKFWGVRREWAAALSKSGTEPAVAALADLLAVEQDPMVLEPLVRAAGAHRDERVRAALEQRLDRGLPHRATTAALEVLGAQRAAAPFDRLAKAAKTEGFGGHVQAGAFRALAASRRPEALAILLERAACGATSNRARPACAVSLGELGRVLERPERERVLERLVDLLRDPHDRVRRAAANGLDSLGESGGIPALRRYRATLSDQDASAIDRLIRSVRREEAPKVAALEKRVEELEEKLRKVDGSVQKIEARSSAGDKPKAKRPGKKKPTRAARSGGKAKAGGATRKKR